MLALFVVTSAIAKQVPQLKYYYNDGRPTKIYNIPDLENINILKGSGSNVMRIFYLDTLESVYPTISIDSVKFGKDTNKLAIMDIFIFGAPRSYYISDLDSIVFNNINTKIANDVVVIDSTKNEEIRTVDSTSIVLDSNSTFGKNLKAGDIISGEPSDNAPDGFLKKIKTITKNGDSIIVETEDAKITDVIENGVISFEFEFNPSDTIPERINKNNEKLQAEEGFTRAFEDVVVYDNDDNYNTTNDQIRVDGSITFTPKIGFNLVIEDWEVKQFLIQMSQKNKFELTAKAFIGIEKEIKKSLNQLLGIKPYQLPPKKIMVGPCPYCIPVIITSNIDVQIGFNLKIGAEISSSITSENSSTSGIEFNSGEWKKISENSSSFNFTPPELSLGGSIKAFLGPQLNVNFYNQQDAFNAWVNVFGFSELEVDLLDKPLWQLSAGVEANAGVKSEWWKELDYELPFVIEYRKLLAQSTDLITSVSPSEAKVGDIITITGKGFGNVRGLNNISFKFGNSLLPIDAIQATEYTSWSDTEIKVKVPNGLNPGDVKLLVNVGGFFSNMTDYKIITNLTYIAMISPNKAAIGETMTIIGLNFGETQGTSIVSFNGINANEFISWSSTIIKVKVPTGTTSGKVSVTANGVKSNEIDFTILPQITTINPTSGKIGDEITINGSGFGSVQWWSFVNFGNTRADNYTSWSDTQINVKVPNGLNSGDVILLVNVGEYFSNQADFKIIESASSISVVLISSGNFQMGNTGNYSGFSSEKPIHTVILTKSFYMSKYEITQSQWKAVAGTDPSYFKGDNLPVENVCWYEAIDFCNKLSEKENLEKCYIINMNGATYLCDNRVTVTCDWSKKGWRLPTEAEWEYACKAGSTSDFFNGQLSKPNCTPLDNNLNTVGWYCYNSSNKTHPVGAKEANDFGLFDIYGNVWEWCWDWYSTYSSDLVNDPTGPSIGTYGIMRGGSWTDYACYCRSSYRSTVVPDYRNLKSNNVGIRIGKTY
jgi:formylglycine-generating enzyme required for sulfatase activity